MMTALKLVPALSLLMTGAAFAQSATSTTPQKEQPKSTTSSQKLVIDPQMHEQMMNDAKRMETEIQSLSKQLESVPRTGETDFRLHE